MVPQDSNAHQARPVAVILAAGQGTRMRSDLPKVLHEVGGRPMVCAVVDACREAGCERIVLVVGYKQDLVKRAIEDQGAAWSEGIEFAVQAQQLGTGHAVRCAQPLVAPRPGYTASPLFVLAGDGPLIRAQTLRRLLERHTSTGAAATLATSIVEDPTGYGRIVRDSAGAFVRIVEHKAGTPSELAIREINPSYYCFEPAALFRALERLSPDSGSGEYYITDVPAMLLAEGARVEVIPAVPPEDVLSINTPEQLAEVDSIYRARPHSAFEAPARRAAPSQKGSRR
jgi:bifunctional UDP-N-acetylglucosamine pyrophosphorylase / glucosamine-1-phosphate N-acetyltransferase